MNAIKKQSEKKIVLAAAAAILIFIISSLIFMESTKDHVKEDILTYMRDLEGQNISTLRRSMDMSLNFVKSLSHSLGKYASDLNSPEAFRYLREHAWYTDFGTLYLINEEGWMFFGDRTDDEERDYYLRLMKDPLREGGIHVRLSEGQNYISANYPIMSGTEVKGVLSARFYTIELNEFISFDIFDKSGYCYLIGRDGSILARSYHPSVNLDAKTIEDLFLVGTTPESKKYYEIVLDAMKKGVNGNLTFPMKGGDRLVSYSPVGTNDLYLLTSVPENTAFARSGRYLINGIAFVLVSIFTFGFLMYYLYLELKRNSDTIKEANRELSLLYESMPGGILRCLSDGENWYIKSVNEGFFKLIGCSKDEFGAKEGNKLSDLCISPVSEAISQAIEKSLVNGKSFESELKIETADGSSKWLGLMVNYVKNEGEQNEILATLSDITGIKNADQDLYVSKEQFEIVKKLTNVIFFEWDLLTDKLSISTNFQDMFAPLASYENFPYSLSGSEALSQEDADRLIFLFEQMEEGLRSCTEEIKVFNKEGYEVWYKLSMSAIPDSLGNTVKVVGVVSDIDEEKRKLESVKEIASKDPLTQLYNKTYTRDLIQKYIEASSNQSAFMMIDIDNFKRVNDTLGHLYGDAVLSELAHTLKTLFRDSDITGRVGGDEFVVFMTNVKETSVIQKKAESILEAFKRSFRKEGVEYGISCSIGISLYPWNGTSYDKLMQKADLSLYFSKSNGKNKYTIYSDNIKESDLSLNHGTRETTDINAMRGLTQKNFRENVAEYILKLFYQYEDVDAAVPVLFEFVGKSFKMGRMDFSVFSEDEAYYEILYEWCEEAVPSLKREGKTFPADEWSSIKAQLDENDILLCEEAEKGIPDYLENDHMKVRGVKSTMLCYIVEGGKRKAVLAFEYFKEKHIFTKEEKDTIRTISDTISLFVLRARERLLYNEKLSQMKNWEVMLDETDDVVYVSDADNYDLLYLNKAGRELPWIKGRDFKGSKCHDFFYGNDQPCPFCTMHLLTKDKYYIWENSDSNSGNHYLLKDKLLDWDGRLARIEWAINLTEKQEQQKKLSSRLKIEKALLEGIGEMSYATTLEESMNIILRRVAELYKADRSYMMRINEDGQTISMTNEWLAEGGSPEFGNLQNFPLDRSPLWRNAFSKQEPVFLTDISKFRESDPDEYQRLAVQGIEDMYAIPITIKGKFWGFVGVDTPRRYKGEMYVLESVAYFVADEISKRRIIESPGRKREMENKEE